MTTKVSPKVTTLPFTEYFESAEQSYTSASYIELDHGLSGKPRFYQACLVCKTTEFGYAVGDEIEIVAYGSTAATLSSSGLTVGVNGTKIFCQVGSNDIAIHRRGATIGNADKVTASNWRVVLKAWR